MKQVPSEAPEQPQTAPVLLADGDNPQFAEPNSPPSRDESDVDTDYEMPGSGWQGWAFALAPILVVLFGAGRDAWSLGLAGLSVGLLIVLFPARRRLPAMAMLSMGGLVLAPLLQFLPIDWAAKQPEWWKHLENDWGIQLSQRLTPQEWVTWESWVVLALCILWLGWSMARGFSTPQRRALTQALALGGILISALSIMDYMRWVNIPWWPSHRPELGDSFGPFANRNHTSSLAALTCLLAASAAYDAYRNRSRPWMLYALGILVPVASIFSNTSRAGVVLLFVGLTAWLGAVTMRKNFFQRMAVAATLIFIIAAVILMSDGGVSRRLRSGSLVTTESTRAELFFQALGMTAKSPWLGVGLGNFERVFPLESDIHDPKQRFLHPESDVLWLLAEGGLLTIVPAILLVFWIFNSTGPWFGRRKKGSSNRLDRRLRNAAGIAFGMGAVHGLVDVPNHGVAYAMFMGLLAGIAIRPRRLPTGAAWTDRLGFRLAGLCLLAAGAAWIGVALGHDTFPGRSASQAARARANQLMDSGYPAEAMPHMNEAVRLAPMNAQLYYERARIRLFNGESRNDALLDFSRSRVLEPNYAGLCYTEGVVWLDFHPPYAIIGWREFLKRYPEAAPGIYGYYRQMLSYASRYPELREPLWSLATSAELKLDYLAHTTTREEFDRALKSLLTQKPNLEGMDSKQRLSLFELWTRIGDEKSLIANLERNKAWREDGWRLLAAHYAKNSDFRSACQIAATYLPSINRSPVGSATDLGSLERALLYNPTDARAAIDLYQGYRNRGDTASALRTLEKVMRLPNAPTYVQQEMAALYMAQEDYRRAWEHYQQAMTPQP